MENPYSGSYQDGFGNRIHVLAAANPAHYYGKTTYHGSPLLHDRGAGYGIIRFNKSNRSTTFECWPRYAGPNGSQYPGWPVTIRQTENEGRDPVGYLPVIDTGEASDPVVRVIDESSQELVFGYRVHGNRFRPPVYAAGRTYRVEVIPTDEAAVQVTSGVVASAIPAHSIQQFEGAGRYAVRGRPFRLRWDCTSAASIVINQEVGNVTARTLHGIGHVDVTPQSDTTWTLTSTSPSGPVLQAQVSVRVFPAMADWRSASFSAMDLADPAKEATVWGDGADPDGDGLCNAAEYAAQTPPQSGARLDVLRSEISTVVVSTTTEQHPVHVLRELLSEAGYGYEAQRSEDLTDWKMIPWSDLREIHRESGAPGQTDRVTYEVVTSVAEETLVRKKSFHRVILKPVAAP
ncbi:MAG: hypothetical protein WED15_09560 [Akkermansiaceae bacterium]